MTYLNLGLVLSAMAQVLVSIAGVNTDNPDELSLLALDTIQPNTSFYLTDNEWDGNTSSFTSGEGYRKLTVQADGWYPGKVIKLDFTNMTTSDSSVLSHEFGSMSLSTVEEGVYLYQGSSYDVPTSFIDAVKLGGTWTSNELSGTGLVDGEEALSFNYDNVDYTGATTGTGGQLLASLEDEANYTGSNSALSLSTADWDVMNCTPTAVSNLTGAINDESIDLSWDAASCASSYLVAVYTSSIASSPSGAASSFVVNSQNYSDGSNPTLGGTAKVLYVGSSTSVTITGLTNQTTYYFKVFSYDSDPTDQWDSGTETNATPDVIGMEITSHDQIFTIDFDQTSDGVVTGVFDASGAIRGSSSGDLNTLGVSITGHSSGDIDFLDNNSNSSIWRGTSTGGVSNGGIYAFDVSNGGTLNTALGFQLDDDDFTPGELIFRFKNSSGQSITNVWFDYLLHTYNDQNSQAQATLSYSTDGTNYTSISNSLLTTDLTASGSPQWSNRIAFQAISGAPLLNDGDYLYLKWTLNSALGSGEMDEVALSKLDIVFHTSTTVNNPGDTYELPTGTYRNVTVANGRALIVPTGNLVVVDGRLKVLGSFTIAKNASFTQTSDSDDNDIDANATVTVTFETPTYASDVYYTYWSSPIDGETMGDAFPSCNSSDFYYYDAEQNIDPDLAWVSASTSTAMTKGQGYITTAPVGTSNASYTATFTGNSINNADVNVNITHFGTVNDADNDWNLLGNPYPSDIDWELFEGESVNDELGTTVYRWNQSSETISAGDYNSYTTTTGGTGGATKYIAPGQGIMVWKETVGDGTVTFKNSHRVDGLSGTFYKGQPNAADQRLWVSVRNSDFYSQSLIAFIHQASDGFDRYDGRRLRGNGTVSISVLEDQEVLAAYASPNMLWGETRVVRLGVDVLAPDSISFALDSLEHEGDVELLLYDSYLGEWTNLQTGSYDVYVDSPQNFEDRFYLHFTDKRNDLVGESDFSDATSVDEVKVDSDWKAWVAHQTLFVRLGDYEKGELSLIDLNGRVLSTYNLSGPNNALPLSNVRSGVYLLRLEGANSVQQIFIE